MNTKLTPVMKYARTLRYMRPGYFTLFSMAFIMLMGCISSAYSQEVLMDLEYNSSLFKNKNKNIEKSTLNQQPYFLIDTLKLPFIEDFSSDRFKKYNSWLYPPTTDSVAIRFTVSGQYWDSLYYSVDTTFHYFYLDTNLTDTLPGVPDSAVALPSFQVELFNGYNPFIPNDTIYVWPYFEIYETLDTLGNHLSGSDSTLIVDYVVLKNSHDTIWVFEADTGAHSLWLDHDVFVNSTYPVRPPSIGVATFDGVDEMGQPYQFVTGLPQGVADHLTSKPIDLHTYTPADSIYFSFYYQPQGRGNAPEQNDSLILQFKTPGLDWKNAWSALGSELSADSVFTQVMLPVADTVWFKNGFQFRFLNQATLSGNVDHWHIDYIRFSNARSYTDTVFEDVAYVYPAYSLLADYQNMPWKHFLVDPASFMNDTLLLTFHNNLNAVKNTGYRWKVFDENGAEIFDKNGGSKNYAANVYCQNKGTECDPTDPFSMTPDFAFTFPDNGNDSASFEILATLASNPDNIKSNDTLRYTQVFDNYYAYDDGSAENGYGLEIQGTSGVSMAAYRFNLIKSDTLRGVRFYFNPQLEDVSQKLFTLMVWTGDETPETVVYENDSLSPIYSPELNGFRTYTMNDDTLILPAGNFFVGWQQLTNYRINVGFDRNMNANENMFFNVLGGGWIQSQLPGAWMIRPVFYNDTLPADVFAIEENAVMTDFSIFPNPASDEVYIVPKDENGTSADYTVNIFNSMGSIVRQVGYLPRSVSIDALAPGFYFISIQNKETQEQKTYKLVISR